MTYTKILLFNKCVRFKNGVGQEMGQLEKRQFKSWYGFRLKKSRLEQEMGQIKQ